MEERLSLLEAESANTVARLRAMEVKMNDRFQLIEEQLIELRRSKVGNELRDEINRRFVEQKELMEARFALVNQHFVQVDQRFDRVDAGFAEERRRHDLTDKRLDRIEIEIRANSRDMRFFTHAVVAGQIGIALAILVMASKSYFH